MYFVCYVCLYVIMIVVCHAPWGPHLDINNILFYTLLYSDFTTSPEFEELWNQVSEELDIQSNVSSVSSTVKETATSPNTKNTEKTSLLKTLLEKSTPSTKTLTTTTVSTSIKKPNVSLSSTPIVSCENDCKIVEVPFKR